MIIGDGVACHAVHGKKRMMVVKIEKRDIPSVINGIWDIFLKYEARKASIEGVIQFRKRLNNELFAGNLAVFGAFEAGKLVGGVVTNKDGSRVIILVSDKKCGIEKLEDKLFDAVLRESSGDTITAIAAEFAADTLRKLGFETSGKTINPCGIPLVQMVYQKKPKKELCSALGGKTDEV